MRSRSLKRLVSTVMRRGYSGNKKNEISYNFVKFLSRRFYDVMSKKNMMFFQGLYFNFFTFS